MVVVVYSKHRKSFQFSAIPTLTPVLVVDKEWCIRFNDTMVYVRYVCTSEVFTEKLILYLVLS
jgi:hypothetical protein